MSKIRRSAKGQECALQIFPYCLGNTETTVLCHMPSEDKGIGIKSPDWWSADGCANCHAVIDGRMKTDLSTAEIYLCMLRGIYRTHKRLIDEGLMEVA